MTKAELQEQIAIDLGMNLAAAQGRGQHLANSICVQRRLSASLRSNINSMMLCLWLGLLGADCGPTRADNAAHTPNPMFNRHYSADAEVPFAMETKATMADGAGQANFESAIASRRTRAVADWVVSSGDNLNLPFAIVDKVNAKVYVFSGDGQLHGAAPVLLGLAQGDYAAVGVGSMRMSRISPTERTTPAGRFVVTMGRNAHGKEVLWVDYKNAISTEVSYF